MSNEGKSVMAVFRAVASHGEISRGELSGLTGFSQMTVGKAVETLTSRGIITEEKEAKGAVGRRSGICRVSREGGMLIFDLTEKEARVRACDLSLNIRGETTIDISDVGAFAMNAFMYFVDTVGGELLYVGCIAPDGKAEECRETMDAAFGYAPRLVLEFRDAFALSCAVRYETSGMAFFLGVDGDGKISGAVTLGGKLYKGAHGMAGDIGGSLTSVDELAEWTRSICAAVDPELIYIACEDETVCRSLSDKIGGESIIVESMEKCADIMYGTARVVRERYILSKLANNT